MSFITSATSADKPNATILQFPSSRALAIRVERAKDDFTWMVLTHRGHAWVHSTFDDALADARTVAASFGLTALTSAGWAAP